MSDVTPVKEGTTAGFGVSLSRDGYDGINTINEATIKILNDRLAETSPVLKHPSVPFESERVIGIAHVLENSYSIFNLQNHGSNSGIDPREGVNKLERPETFSFKEIGWEGSLFKLKHPIDVRRTFHDGFWTVYNEQLEILAIAPDPEQCEIDFQEEFCILWEEYADTPDDELSLDGRKLKYKLREVADVVVSED